MATEDETTQPAGTPSAPGGSSPEDGPDAAVVQCAHLFLVVRRLLFTSLGALALTAEEARAFVDRLVERGEIGEGDVQHWVDDLQGAPSTSAPANHYPNGEDGQMEALWGRLRVPTHREIEDLSRKIGALDAKLMNLRRQRGRQSPTAGAEPPPLPDA